MTLFTKIKMAINETQKSLPKTHFKLDARALSKHVTTLGVNGVSKKYQNLIGTTKHMSAAYILSAGFGLYVAALVFFVLPLTQL